MASRLTDRLLTIVITATLTSAAWIVMSSFYVNLDGPGEFAPATEPDGQGEATPTVSAARRSEPVAPTVLLSMSGQLVIPVLDVSAAELTDTYSEARGDGGQPHEAIDIMAPAGTPIVAAGPGTIERLFLSKAGGNAIYLRSRDRQTLHYYAHLQDYAPGLQEGQQVRRGQRLGTVGVTGNADPAAPHLHFAILRTTPDAEWWEPARAVNPFPRLGGADVN